MAKADPTPDDPSPGPAAPAGRNYTVVARRYRPQTFEQVVGQDHIVHALRNAIRLDRVAQAYLFCGTRGVGKTSIARIFAKCLNCARSDRPTEAPCNRCETCLDIAAGQDIDVIEIDGASNNGVDAVRELRQNAGLRPSRSRYKIYYIDEVHMLSTGAFNALLKTLEEPPPHVKFLFATTEANKIPITVLSRCQVFSFAGIGPGPIAASLAEICRSEGIEAEPAALELVARRALGSLRDAQSLLERLLASGRRPLTLGDAQSLLGVAGDDRVLDLLDAITTRDPAAALRLIDQAVGAGVQPTELLGGVLEMLRDAMILAAGAADVGLQAVSAGQRPRLESIASRWSLDTLLAAQQILAEARGRLRGSPYGRLIVELAFCRLARLEDLEELSQLIARLDGDGGPALPAEKKKAEPAPRGDESRAALPARGVPSEATPTLGSAASAPPTAARLGPREAWPLLAQKVPELWHRLRDLEPTDWVDGRLVVPVAASYNWAVAAISDSDRVRIEMSLGALLGRPAVLDFRREVPVPASSPAAEPPRPAAVGPAPTEDPLVRKIIELFDVNHSRIMPDQEATAEEVDD